MSTPARPAETPPQIFSSPPRPEPDDWLSPAQAASWLHVGRRVVYKAIAAHDLRAACVNGRKDYRIHRSWLVAWMSRRAEAPRPNKPYRGRRDSAVVGGK